MTGQIREGRGHRYAGGPLGTDAHERRHYEWVALAVAAVATAVSTYAGYEQAQTANKQAEQQAEEVARVTGLQEQQARETQTAQFEAEQAAAEMNQRQAIREAGLVRGVAEAQAQDVAEKNRRIMARQRALAGGSGYVTSEGTPLLSLLDAAEQDAIEQAQIRKTGELQAEAFESEAEQQRLRRESLRKGTIVSAGPIRVSQTSPALAAGTTLLSGLSNVSNIYARSRIYGKSSGAEQL